MVGGFATLFSVYWPWKGGNASCRLRGRVRFKYSTNNGLFSIGRGDAKFTLQFSKSSDADIYLYNDPSDIEAVALAGGVGQTSDIKDASSFDFSNRVISVGEGKAAVLRRHNKKYAVVQIHDVIVSNIDDDDSVDEVVFTYTINTNGSADFS